MTNKSKFRLFVYLFILLGSSQLMAQSYDDMYYDPSQDNQTYYEESYQTNDNFDNDNYRYENDRFDDRFDDDHYDYYYTSRIRRFHRPYYGFNYFDPVYVDLGYYDPFFNPAATVLIYDIPYSYNAYRRWRRFNRWNSWNRWNGFNRWNDPFFNPYFDPFYSPRFNRGWGGFYNGFGLGFGNFGFAGLYCPPSWGGGFAYNTVSNAYINNVARAETSRNVYYGPRRGGSGVISRTRNAQTGLQADDRSVRNRSSANVTKDRTTINKDGIQSSDNIRTRESSSYSRSRTTISPNTRETVTQDEIRRDRQSRSYARERANSNTYKKDPAVINRSSSQNRSYSRSYPSYDRGQISRSRSSDYSRSNNRSNAGRSSINNRSSRSTYQRSPSTYNRGNSTIRSRSSSSVTRSRSSSSISRSSGSSSSSRSSVRRKN